MLSCHTAKFTEGEKGKSFAKAFAKIMERKVKMKQEAAEAEEAVILAVGGCSWFPCTTYVQRCSSRSKLALDAACIIGKLNIWSV